MQGKKRRSPLGMAARLQAAVAPGQEELAVPGHVQRDQRLLRHLRRDRRRYVGQGRDNVVQLDLDILRKCTTKGLEQSFMAAGGLQHTQLRLLALVTAHSHTPCCQDKQDLAYLGSCCDHHGYGVSYSNWHAHHDTCHLA